LISIRDSIRGKSHPSVVKKFRTEPNCRISIHARRVQRTRHRTTGVGKKRPTNPTAKLATLRAALSPVTRIDKTNASEDVPIVTPTRTIARIDKTKPN
jgi:hypothetical protein